MVKWLRFVRQLLLPTFLALLIFTQSERVRGEEPTCGALGKPPCPLQVWMRQQAARALAERDRERLVKAFRALESHNPNPRQWGNWSRFAREGAERAEQGEFRAARVYCGRCHRVYRRQYNARYRRRPAPPLEG